MILLEYIRECPCYSLFFLTVIRKTTSYVNNKTKIEGNVNVLANFSFTLEMSNWNPLLRSIQVKHLKQLEVFTRITYGFLEGF